MHLYKRTLLFKQRRRHKGKEPGDIRRQYNLCLILNFREIII